MKLYGRKEYVDGDGAPDPKEHTRNNEVWALRKDSNTFGTLYPKKGSIEPEEKEKDTFVILHIDMPQQYVEAAEKKA